MLAIFLCFCSTALCMEIVRSLQDLTWSKAATHKKLQNPNHLSSQLAHVSGPLSHAYLWRCCCPGNLAGDATACELDDLWSLREYVALTQVSSNKVARAENASLRSELGGLRSQLSETSKQLEAERATSEALPSYAQVFFTLCLAFKKLCLAAAESVDSTTLRGAG